MSGKDGESMIVIDPSPVGDTVRGGGRRAGDGDYQVVQQFWQSMQVERGGGWHGNEGNDSLASFGFGRLKLTDFVLSHAGLKMREWRSFWASSHIQGLLVECVI
jgi:hypothetical protein